MALPEHAARRPMLTGARGLSVLVGVALTLLLTLHFLSERDSAGDHRPELAGAFAVVDAHAIDAGGAAGDLRSGTPVLTAATDAPGGDVHQIIADCALLLAAVITLLLARRTIATHSPAAPQSAAMAPVRGPPASFSRLSLCVTRV